MNAELPSKPTSVVSSFIQVFIVFSLFGIFTLLMLARSKEVPSYEDERAINRLAVLHQMQAEQSVLMTNTTWVDPQKGIVHIPLQLAMEKELAVLKNETPHAGSPVNPVVPAAAPAAPAPAATNAAAHPAATATTNQPAAPAKPGGKHHHSSTGEKP